MWLFTQDGFYSIVKHTGKADTYLVRARERVDMENLLALTGLELPLTETPTADYRYRLEVTGEQLQVIRDAVFTTIGYPNFKNAVHERPDQANKNAAYMQIWGVMNRVQEKERRK